MSDLSAFKASFKGDVVTPEDPAYEEALTRWAANARRRAAVVAFVRDEEDIVLAIKYARSSGLPIAIRGGGHNPAGSSSSEGGLVIDLSRHLAGVRVDAEKKLAYADGGALWGTFNNETMKYGLATTGGTVSHTGVGGLTLGGGYGVLAGEHGMTVDNLVEARVVTADGTVLTASSEENSDIFWGLRGGGSNFGVVSLFVYKVHPQRETVYSGMAIWPASALEELTAISAARFTKPKDPRAMFMLLVSLSPDPSHTPCVILQPFFNGSEAEGREHFKDFFSVGPILADMTREMPYTVVNTLLDDGVPVGGCYYLKSVYMSAPNAKVAQDVAASVYALSKEHSLKIMFAWEHWNLDKVRAVPADAMAFKRPASGLSCLVIVEYPEDTPEQLALVRKSAEQLATIVTSAEASTGTANLGYANYNSDAPTEVLDPNSNEGILSDAKTHALFGENHTKLAALKQKYDPDMVFNKWYAVKPTAAK
ncbi:FAD-binding domain-containing protein [Peniophora sp. CONT]|nr:FAD-binding domain-containing protein [Peniophora sp. CONT]